LEESLEFANSDECVEVTPEFVRIRKVTLANDQRLKEQSRAKKQQ
jgi:GTP-binding protein